MGRATVSNKEVRSLLEAAYEMGFTWDGKLTGSGHLKLKHPKRRGMVILACTPGKNGERWKLNCLRDMRAVMNGE